MSDKYVLDDKYVVLCDCEEKKEGEGATSKIFKVEDMKTNKIYAAKIFKKDSSCFKIEEECLTLLKKKELKTL